jgi:hypothetical protein
MIDNGDCGAIGGMKIDRGNRSTLGKHATAPLYLPQIPHDQTRAAAVGSQRLTALSSWVAAQLVASEEGLSSMKLVSYLFQRSVSELWKYFNLYVLSNITRANFIFLNSISNKSDWCCDRGVAFFFILRIIRVRIWGGGGIAPLFLTSTLYEGEWSASHPGHFTPSGNSSLALPIG